MSSPVDFGTVCQHLDIVVHHLVEVIKVLNQSSNDLDKSESDHSLKIREILLEIRQIVDLAIGGDFVVRLPDDVPHLPIDANVGDLAARCARDFDRWVGMASMVGVEVEVTNGVQGVNVTEVVNRLRVAVQFHLLQKTMG